MKNSAICLLAAGLMIGCSQNDTKTDTSAGIDLTREKDSLQKTFNKTERELKKGAEEAKAKLQDAGDTVKEKLQTAKDKLSDDKSSGVKIELKK